MSVNCNKLGYRLCAAQHFKPEYTRKLKTQLRSQAMSTTLLTVTLAPIVYFLAEEKPNRVPNSGPFSAKIMMKFMYS